MARWLPEIVAFHFNPLFSSTVITKVLGLTLVVWKGSHAVIGVRPPKLPRLTVMEAWSPRGPWGTMTRGRKQKYQQTNAHQRRELWRHVGAPPFACIWDFTCRIWAPGNQGFPKWLLRQEHGLKGSRGGRDVVVGMPHKLRCFHVPL